MNLIQLSKLLFKPPLSLSNSDTWQTTVVQDTLMLTSTFDNRLPKKHIKRFKEITPIVSSDHFNTSLRIIKLRHKTHEMMIFYLLTVCLAKKRCANCINMLRGGVTIINILKQHCNTFKISQYKFQVQPETFVGLNNKKKSKVFKKAKQLR
jgi:lipopolysaccharide assembly outer membrane protein LptD (OstA)